jgi:hypothetical protein
MSMKGPSKYEDFMKRYRRTALIIFNSLLALTSIAGGIGLLLELNAPPKELLKGSPFPSYVIPGLALLILVGGSAAAATVTLILNHRRSKFFVLLAALAIIIFEVLEIIIIGSPEGVARNLQVLYLAVGLVIGLLIFV